MTSKISSNEKYDEVVDFSWGQRCLENGSSNDGGDLNLVEYVLPLAPHQFFPDYFNRCRRTDESIRLILHGREFCVYGFTEEERNKEFNDSVQELIEPAIKNQELLEVAQEFLKNNLELAHLANKWHMIKSSFKGEYTKTRVAQFFLGEELSKRLLPKLEPFWWLERDRVPRLQELVGYYLQKAKEEKNLGAQKYAELLKKKFEQKIDYLFEDDFLPQLLPVLKRPLQSWPRIEAVRQELRRYFYYENLLENFTSEMAVLLERVLSKLSFREREQIGRDLEEVDTFQEKIRVIKNHGIHDWVLPENEERIFLKYLDLYLDPINEELSNRFELVESSLVEEILEYLQNIDKSYEPKPFFQPGRKNLEKIMELLIPIGKQIINIYGNDALQNFLSDLDSDSKTKCPFELSSPLQDRFNCFLNEFIEHRAMPLIMEDKSISSSEIRKEHLVVLEANAQAVLQKVCAAANVIITFKQHGRELTVGSLDKTSEEDMILQSRFHSANHRSDES